jgi:hypothetical protein
MLTALGISCSRHQTHAHRLRNTVHSLASSLVTSRWYASTTRTTLQKQSFKIAPEVLLVLFVQHL